MTANYFQVSLSNVPQESEDVLTEFCFAFGAGGMAEELNFSQDLGCWEGKTIEQSIKSIAVYFEQRPSEEFFLQLSVRFPQVKFQLKEEENKDWLEEWKKGYDSFVLSPGFWIVPSWKEPPAEAKTFLKIDPRMAFGTGTHNTTQLAAQLIAEYLPQTANSTFLDVGTGTGILAMMARKLGSEKVVGVELDEGARSVARENCQLNSLPDIEILDEQVGDLKGGFDWVVANIIDGILVNLQDDLMRLCSGHLLLTGILEEREEIFLREFHFQDKFEVVSRIQNGEWIGFLLARKS